MECPNDCDYMPYKITTTFDNYPSPSYAEYLKTNPVVKKHFADINQSVTIVELERIWSA